MAFASIEVVGINLAQNKNANSKGSNKTISIIALKKTLDQKRVLIPNDPTKEVLCVFKTPINVWVSKVSYNPTENEINSNYQQIVGHEKLKGNFEFYYGKHHERDGGEAGATYGLLGKGVGGSFVYYYKFVYVDLENNKSHDYEIDFH